LKHFGGNLDACNPVLVDRLAREREVVSLDNHGVGASTGVVPDNVEDMARDVLRFVDALGADRDRCARILARWLRRADAGADASTADRRHVLAGTAPHGAPAIYRWTDDVYALATPDSFDPDGFVRLFSSSAEEGHAIGMEFSGASPRGRPIPTTRRTSRPVTLRSPRSPAG
jgi:hypothetical protein